MTFEVNEIIALATLAVSAGIAWGTVKAMLSKHEKEISVVKEDGIRKIEIVEKQIKEITQKQETTIKELLNKVERIENSIQRAIDHETAERKFVTQKELQLRLENIYSQINSIDKKIDLIIEYIKGKTP